MFPKFNFARSLATVALTTVMAAVNAQVLVEHQGTSYRTGSDTFAPLADVLVGAADVRIGGFGVYGQTSVPANVRWVVFDAASPKSPTLLSSIQAIEAEPGSFATAARWHDSPTLDLTLQAGHRYAIGVISDTLGPAGFRWGVSVTQRRYGGGGPEIGAHGLSLSFSTALANAGLAGSFYSTPAIYTFDRADPLEWSNAIQPSLRIMMPVREPHEWGMLLSGLSLVGLIARRRKLRLKQEERKAPSVEDSQ